MVSAPLGSGASMEKFHVLARRRETTLRSANLTRNSGPTGCASVAPSAAAVVVSALRPAASLSLPVLATEAVVSGLVATWVVFLNGSNSRQAPVGFEGS